MRRYVETLKLAQFRRIWIGATASALGDGMTWVALLWLVYDQTGSPELAGALVFTYGAPVLVGGLLTGPVLDRWGARQVIIWDSVLRGVVMAAVPLAAAFGIFHIAEAFVIAGLYGLLKMVPLAGVPSLIAEYVPEERRNTANALENLSFSIGLSVAPAAAGILIAATSATAVLAIDAATFFAFAALLARTPRRALAAGSEVGRNRLRDALLFIARQPQIRFITLMFASYNVGLGALYVALAVYARDIVDGSSAAFGVLVASSFGGMLVGSLLAGAVEWRLPLGRSVAAAQLLAGIAIFALVTTPPLAVAVVVLAVHGFASSPLSIWAQTIRMALIPPELRGRVFALVRTGIQAAEPAGGAIGGIMIGALGFVPTAWLIAAAKAAPATLGLLHRDLEEPVVDRPPAINAS